MISSFQTRTRPILPSAALGKRHVRGRALARLGVSLGCCSSCGKRPLPVSDRHGVSAAPRLLTMALLWMRAAPSGRGVDCQLLTVGKLDTSTLPDTEALCSFTAMMHRHAQKNALLIPILQQGICRCPAVPIDDNNAERVSPVENGVPSSC